MFQIYLMSRGSLALFRIQLRCSVRSRSVSNPPESPLGFNDDEGQLLYPFYVNKIGPLRARKKKFDRSGLAQLDPSG